MQIGHLTLIEPKSDFYFAIGAARAIVDSDFANLSFLSYKTILPAVKHVQQYVKLVDFEKKVVHVYSGESIPYDYLVLATGRAYGKPFRWEQKQDEDAPDADPEILSTEQLLQQLSDQRNLITNAEHVVIVGGGATGIETAGEIKDLFPEKKVTIFQSKARLMISQPEVSDADASSVLEKLKKLGISVKLNAHYEEPSNPTASGSTCIIHATGGRPNTQFLPDGLCSSDGTVRTDSHLNLLAHKDVFAMGDIVFGAQTNVKTAQILHMPLVQENLTRLIKGKSHNDLKTLGKLPGPLSNMFVVPIGRTEILKKGFIGTIIGGMKQNDYFLSRSRKEFGASD